MPVNWQEKVRASTHKRAQLLKSEFCQLLVISLDDLIQLGKMRARNSILIGKQLSSNNLSSWNSQYQVEQSLN